MELRRLLYASRVLRICADVLLLDESPIPGQIKQTNGLLLWCLRMAIALQLRSVNKHLPSPNTKKG